MDSKELLWRFSIGERDFSNSWIDKGNFAGANLSGIDFSKSRLIGTSFSGATLRGANFSGANLTEANFNGADLTGANFKFAMLGFAKFEHSILSAADFDYAQDLKFAVFEGSNVQATNMIKDKAPDYFYKIDANGRKIKAENVSMTQVAYEMGKKPNEFDFDKLLINIRNVFVAFCGLLVLFVLYKIISWIGNWEFWELF